MNISKEIQKEFKILIADDEELIRERLKYAVDWQQCGCQIAGLARNGDDAYAQTAALLPDIVLTDIRMPGCSGIQYLEKINQLKDKPKVIVLSGYDDFKYAQDALKLGAVDYVLKPAEEEELLAAVQKCIALIQEEEKNRHIISDYHAQLPKLKYNFYFNLINGHISDSYYREQIQKLNVDTENQNHIVFIIHIDFDLYADFNDKDKQLLEYGISNIVKELLESYSESAVLLDPSGDIISVAASKDDCEALNASIEATCQSIKNIVNNIYDETVSIGIGDTVSDLRLLHQSFMQAQKALNLKEFLGNNSVYTKEEKQDDFLVHFARTYQLDKLLTNLKLMDKKATLSSLNEVMDSLAKKQEHSWKPIDIKIIYFDIMFSVFKNIASYRTNDEMKMFDMNFFKQVNHLQNIEQLKVCLTKYLDLIIDSLQNQNLYSKSKIVELAMDYIDRHYQEPISLNDVIHEIHLNPSYFCKVFKNQTGMTFKQYLTQYRINKAVVMLQDPRNKVYEVAEKVGYPDVQYFSKVFKEITGVSATHFREKSI